MDEVTLATVATGSGGVLADRETRTRCPQCGLRLFPDVSANHCHECGMHHDKDRPHDADSLLYQFRFWSRYGRYPTHVDAMAHCPDDTKAAVRLELSERGIDPTEPTTKSWSEL
jgi:ribosomal protein L37E